MPAAFTICGRGIGRMTPITIAAAQICAQPAPVILLDTCTLLDLFRPDSTRRQPRVVPDEIPAAAELLQRVTACPDAAHLVVPELVPGEFADHAGRIEREFQGWLGFHDENQRWLAEAALWVGMALPSPQAVQPLGLQTALRKLAEDLLARTIVLARDQTCLERAVARLIAKRRPSHKKEMKDSMNLEQCLEFSAQLRRAGFTNSLVFVSSNTSDFAEAPTSTRLHPDLQGEFAAASLEFFASLRAALGSLRAKGRFP
jgi:hypothetical protein